MPGAVRAGEGSPLGAARASPRSGLIVILGCNVGHRAVQPGVVRLDHRRRRAWPIRFR